MNNIININYYILNLNSSSLIYNTSPFFIDLINFTNKWQALLLSEKKTTIYFCLFIWNFINENNYITNFIC